MSANQDMEYDKAMRKFNAAVRDWALLEEAGVDCFQGIPAMSRLEGSVLFGLYRHFKSRQNEPKYYVAYGVVCDVNLSVAPNVPYFSLYGPHAG